MSSSKALVLQFIERYIDEHQGISPSSTEIGEGTGLSRERARVLVNRLAAEQRIVLVPDRHRRRIVLPDRLEKAKCELRAAGWKLKPGQLVLEHAVPLAKTTLPFRAALDHIPDGEIGSGRDDGDEPG